MSGPRPNSSDTDRYLRGGGPRARARHADPWLAFVLDEARQPEVEIGRRWKSRFRRGSLYGEKLQSYASAERRARRLLPKTGCSLADETCKGRLEMTFRHDAPPDWVRFDPHPYDPRKTELYWVGPADRIREAYRWLCKSHHARTDPAHIQNAENAKANLRLTSPTMRANRPATTGIGGGYSGTHAAARHLLSGRECIQLDQSCRGPVFAALRLSTPTARLRSDTVRERVYSTDPEDYDPLCQSHAQRRDIAGRPGT